MDSSEDVNRYMEELLRRQRRGERITIEIGPHGAESGRRDPGGS